MPDEAGRHDDSKAFANTSNPACNMDELTGS